MSSAVGFVCRLQDAIECVGRVESGMIDTLLCGLNGYVLAVACVHEHAIPLRCNNLQIKCTISAKRS